MMKLSNKTFLVGISFLLTIAMFGAGCKSGPDDATLAANVKAKLAADAALSAVAVTAKDGAVTLSGVVNTEADRGRAEQIARGVEGVKSVVNSTTARPAVPTMAPVVISPDTTLKSSVTANLAKYGVTGITADVADGVVTLKGDIARAKLQDAIKAANEAKPKKVVNQLTIK